MLFTKPINDITYDDVKCFVLKNERESVNLDYKEDFPNNLEKTICAFANTYGGVIIIGVKDTDGYPVPDSSGLDFKEGFVERVTQISIGNIYPPIVPEIQVAHNAKKAFVVVRISQEKEAPYTVKHKYPYVRTGNVSTPEDFATFDRLEWLGRQREKMRLLREEVVNEIELRCSNMEKLHDLKIPFGAVTMEIGPLYPFQQLINPKSLPQILDASVVSAYGAGFPNRSYSPRSVKNGIAIVAYQEPSKNFDYFELNSYGFVLFKKDLGLQKVVTHDNGKQDVSEQRFHLNGLLFYSDLFINFANTYYSKLKYFGTLRFSLSIDGMFKIPVCYYNSGQRFSSNGFTKSVDDSLRWNLEMSTNELGDEVSRFNKVLDLNDDVAFSFGYQSERGHIEKILKTAPYYKEVSQEK